MERTHRSRWAVAALVVGAALQVPAAGWARPPRSATPSHNLRRLAGRRYLDVTYRNLEILEKDRAREVLAGFWGARFPSPSSTWGYVFLRNGTYAYLAPPGPYCGSYGRWRVRGAYLWVLPWKHLVWESPGRSDTVAGWYPGDGNIIRALASPDRGWQEVADLRSYNAYWHPKAEALRYPPSLKILGFDRDGRIARHVDSFFKLKEPREAVQAFGRWLGRFQRLRIEDAGPPPTR